MNVHFEVPTGAIDGVNLVFYVSLPYVPGSTAVWINGLLLERTLDDGWIESNPATGEITLKEPPRPIGHGSDVIQVFFKDNSPALPETVIEFIVGTISDLDGSVLFGTLESETELFGAVGEQTELSGSLVNEVPSLQGVLEPQVELVGTLIGDC